MPDFKDKDVISDFQQPEGVVRISTQAVSADDKYKNIQEGYEMDCTIYSHIPGGRLYISQTHEETARVKQSKQERISMEFYFLFFLKLHGTDFCLPFLAPRRK